MKLPSQRGIFWITVLVAGVSVAVAAGPLPWRLAGDSGVMAPAAPEVAPREARVVSLRSILDLSPFGAAGAPAADAEVPVADLGLILHGVIIARPSDRSGAIISGADQPARAYGVGDAITGAAMLGSVFPDHVVLRVDDHNETLWFPRVGSEGSGRAVSPGSGVAALRALVTSGESGAEAEAGAPPARGDAGAANDTEAVIDRYRARLRDNPATVLGSLGLELTEGGYVVGPNASDGVLSAGLRPGDVVSRVNGQQIGNLQDDRELFDTVVASGRARVEISRDGQPIVLSFPLR